MKTVLASVFVLFAAFSVGCRCTAEKNAVSQIEATHDQISKKLLDYVEKDPALSSDDKTDWKKLVESDARNIQALKRSLED